VIDVYSASIASITQLMDGTRSGWEIIEHLNSRGDGITARYLESLFRRFAIAGIASFESQAASYG
jgi:hypothetical protein